MTHFAASQCTGPGFCMNCNSIPTVYAVSGHNTTIGQSIDPIALQYGIPFIQAACVRLDGHCLIE